MYKKKKRKYKFNAVPIVQSASTIARFFFFFFGSLCPTNRMEFVVENIEAPN